LFRERPLAKVHYHPSPTLHLSDSVKQVVTFCINSHTHTHTHNHFTALLEFVRYHPGEQVPER